MKLLPYGTRAVLVEVPGAASVPAVCDALAALPAVIEVVGGARSVLVSLRSTVDDTVREHILRAAQAAPGDRPEPNATTVTLAVRYDGPDLGGVARECGLTTQEVVDRHLAPRYTVAFCGFAPGFAYLVGLDPALQVPRLGQPRARVPAGAVGIAGEFTGAYPRASPGGWRLIGSTEAVLWDAHRAEPALLSPGTTVRFVAA
jgi:KipI family sensor histidine kinase inhibitor